MSERKKTAPADPARIAEAMQALEVTARALSRQLGERFDLDDLKSFGHGAVTEVVARFDPSRGVAFGAYARLRLRGAMLDGVRKEAGLPRGIAERLRALESADLFVEAHAEEHGAPTRSRLDAKAADERLGTFLRGIATAYAAGLVGGVGREGEEVADPTVERGDDPELGARRAEMRAILEKAMAGIGEQEETILRKHYFEDLDLQDAAASMGLSKSWGSRLHARAIAKLAEKIREMRIDDDS